MNELTEQNCSIQVNLCQKLFFLQNMGRTCCVQKLFRMSKTISVHNMFSPCSELGIFTYWTCNSINNLSSYCGGSWCKIRASDKDLSVLYLFFNSPYVVDTQTVRCEKKFAHVVFEFDFKVSSLELNNLFVQSFRPSDDFFLGINLPRNKHQNKSST